MDDTLLQLVSGWPWLTASVTIVGGIWSIGRVRQAPVVDRPDRGTAIWLAAGLATCAGLGVIAFAPLGSNPVGGPIILFLVLGIALAGAGFLFLSALLGYVVLARPRVGAIALAGILLGPLFLGGTTALAVSWKQDLQVASYHAPKVQPPRQVAISAEDVRVTTRTYRDSLTGRDFVIVGAVHLTMAVHFEGGTRRLPGDGAGGPIDIWLQRPGFVMWADYLPWPSSPPGPGARYPVQFSGPTRTNLDARELQALSESGTWTLVLQFQEKGQQYEGTAPVTVTVDGPG